MSVSVVHTTNAQMVTARNGKRYNGNSKIYFIIVVNNKLLTTVTYRNHHYRMKITYYFDFEVTY